MLRIIPDPYIEYSLESIKSAILSDSKQSCISTMNKALNNLEYARYYHIDNYRYNGIYRTYVLGPGFIEQTFLEQMFEGNVGGLPVGIMTDCKNLFLQEPILRFVECKNRFNLFLFFDRVQGRNKLTLDNGIIIVYNVGNNQSRRLK